MKRLLIEFVIVLLVILSASCWWSLQLAGGSFSLREDAPLRVAIIMPGSRSDGSWVNVHCEAFEKLQKESRLELFYQENVSEMDDSIGPVVDALVQEHQVQLVFALSYAYGPALRAVAAHYPSVKFFHATGDQTQENVATYFGRMYQARYLTGIVAGLQTKTNHMGYIASYPVPEVIRGINAFTLGVRSVNPQAVVHVRWAWSWEDAAKEKRTAEDLLSVEPVDILVQHQNRNNLAEVAKAHHIYMIGYNAAYKDDYTDTLLTAAVWDWTSFYRQRLQEYRAGSFCGKNYAADLKDGTVEVVPLADFVVPEAQAQVDAAKARLCTGGWDIFYGPVYDQNGWLRVRAGETMSDAQLINDFDWFVEGVEGTVRPFLDTVQE